MRTDTNYNGGYDPGSLTTGTWQLVAATWSASDNQLRVFKNGVQQGATTLNGSHLFSNSAGETGYPENDYVDEPTLGNTPNNDRDYNGQMQEARLSKIARSADWLLTEYNNQSDPSSFYSVGASACLSLSGFSCNVDRKEIGFNPITSVSKQSNLFRTFWTNGLSWGIYEQRYDQKSGEWTSEVRVLGGKHQED